MRELQKLIKKVNSEDIPDVTVEIENAVETTKSNMAPGCHNITSDVIKLERNEFGYLERSKTVLLLKKEIVQFSKTIDQLNKLFTKIITNRLTNNIAYYQPKDN